MQRAQVRPFDGAVRLGWTLVVALGLSACVFCGCHGDHRMSADAFLKELHAARNADLAPLNSEESEILRTLFAQQLSPFLVGPGDVLAVTVSGPDPEPLLPIIQARVDRNGEIFLPMVGGVDVAAMELEDAEKAIHKAYVPDFVRDASVYVELLDEGATEVLVKGAVETPGLVTLRRSQCNLLYAIVEADGVSEVASGRVTLRRIRHPEQELTVDVTTPAGLRLALAQPPLESGDIVSVEAAMPNTIFVFGLVGDNRPQQYRQGVRTTVLQVLAAAGGLRTDITPREATLIRRMPDGTDRHVRLDLDRIRTGRDENILLAAGDILEVPHTLETRVQDFINRNFFLRAGISVNYNISGIEFLNRQDQQAGRFGGTTLQDQFDPFGFLGRNEALSSLAERPATAP
jgi:protein involved in polysaccharide export with SLBB domain